MVENRWAYIKSLLICKATSNAGGIRSILIPAPKVRKNSSSKHQKAKEKMFLNFNGIEKIMYEKGIGLFVVDDINILYERH